jgi:hypothetical protein
MSDRDRAVFPVRDLPVPHLRRWVLFVDGENLTLRAQQLARDTGVRLSEGPFYSRDTFVWIACWPGVRGMEAARSTIPLQAAGIRAYYYTSVVGNEEKIRSAKEALYEMQFKPKVFRRSKTRGSKAVDITLATDMLDHAHRGDYDVAVLCAGDGDYVPLIEEVKRLGKSVPVAFFEASGLSDELCLASDTVLYLDDLFFRWWKVYLEKEGSQSGNRGHTPSTQATPKLHPTYQYGSVRWGLLKMDSPYLRTKRTPAYRCKLKAVYIQLIASVV